MGSGILEGKGAICVVSLSMMGLMRFDAIKMIMYVVTVLIYFITRQVYFSKIS